MTHPGLTAAREPRADGPGPGTEELRTAYLALLKLALCDLVGTTTGSVGRMEDGAVVDQYNWPTLAPGTNVPGFGRDGSGELYILGANGVVYRIVPG